MNKTFKVVFNEARGALMVVNELTSVIQKKGSKTVVAVAVATALSGGVAVAADYSQTEGNSGYSMTTAEESQKVFNSGETLNMSITGADTRAYGMLANGSGHQYTNEGTINVNLATTDASSSWQIKGMMADQGGTVVNKGIIQVTNAYGMTVGSSKGDGEANTIVNDNIINVVSGVGIEAAPTGSAGTTGTARAVVENNGEINVTSGTAILVSGNDGVITNNGIINADGLNAVLIQKENNKTAQNNVINFSKTSNTVGNITVGSGVIGTKLNFEDGALFDGRISVNNGTQTQISGSFDVNGRELTSGNGAGAVIFLGDANSTLTLVDSSFQNNKVIGPDVYGGVIYAYGTPLSLEGGSISGNSALSTGANVNSNGIVQTGASGGAIMIKGSPSTVFKDVLFTNNSVVSKKTETTTGGYATGGAIAVDFSTGNATGVERDSDITFKITKDLTYFGNTVSSDSSADQFDTYGYHLNSASAGGFLFLDRGSDAVFDIDEGASLTIGQSVTSDDTDSIASSIPNTNTTTNNGKHASLTKIGSGTLIINSSLNKYYGTLAVEAGELSVNSEWSIKNAVTVDSGAQLTLSSFSIADAANSGNQDASGNAIGGNLVISGTLETSSAQIFTKALDAEASVADAEGVKYTTEQVAFNEGATLALTDAQYNLAYAQSAGDLLTGANVIMLGNLVGEVSNNVTLDDIENVGGNVQLTEVTVDAENKNIQIGGSAPSDQNTAYRSESLSVGVIDLGNADSVTVTGGKELSLAGNGTNVIASANNDPISVSIEGGSALNLGGQYSKGGQITGTVTIDADSSVNVTGNSDFIIDSLAGEGTVNVGSEEIAGNLTVNSLADMTGIIFIDPAWKQGTNHVADASYFGYTGKETLNVAIVNGRNSVAGFGGSKDDAVAAFEKIASINGLAWGPDGVTSAFYAGSTVDLGTTGGILVDGSLTQAPTSIAHALTVNKQGMLIVDQAKVSQPVVKGDVILNQGSYLSINNASVSSFDLASGAVTDNGTRVVTDNPFIQAQVDGNKVVGSYNAENGLSALASTGIQAMTRRADMMLAQSIADRTSIDQNFGQGANLWVDVSGESYDVDHLDNGGEFEADMGYGAFGADFGLTETVTAGAAIQYGAGSLSSSVSSIKNDIKNYGVALYAAKAFGPVKLVGELTYVQSDNDVTSSQAAMNQSVDAKIYSAGVRAQYQLTAGAFQFVPSIGVRVSKLKTDAMDIGTVKVDEQDQTLVQMPISLRINAFEQKADGWTFAPTMRVAYIPTFGDKEIEVYNQKQDVIDTSPVQADLGLRAHKGNLLFNAQMTVGGGKDGASSVGGKVGMKYMF